ncbi:MAG TPA: hypothetical protein VFQ51_00280 [Vicinamibacteria bacterium]|nr:hypothetical protein [Vicinamibacteria bacterium]
MSSVAFVLALMAAQPAAPEASLPEGHAFVRGLVGAQKKNEEALNRYTYDLLDVREELDDKGRVKKRHSRLQEVFYVKGRQVGRLVSEDDVPLAPEKQAKEDKKVSAKVKSILEERTVSEKPGVRLSQILERYDFRSIARETIDGRSALVLDFSARPGKRDLDGDSVLRRLTGRIWVDEEERQVVRAEFRNTDSVSFGLGIAKLSRLDAFLEFRKLEDGVWLPRSIRLEYAGRKVFKGFRTRQTATFDRFRQFEVEADEELRPEA